jgi:excisionase family DNA binding protein
MSDEPKPIEGLAPPSAFKNYMTLKEASELVGVPKERLAELAASKHVPHIRIDGGPPLFHKRELVPWVETNLVERVEGDQIPYRLKTPDGPVAYDRLPNILEPLRRRLHELRASTSAAVVYFLVKDHKVLYVGKSIRLAERVLEHRADRRDWDRVFFLPCLAEEMNDLEEAWITACNPPWNKKKTTISQNGYLDECQRSVELVSSYGKTTPSTT